MAEPGGCRAVVRPDVTTSAGACSPALGGKGPSLASALRQWRPAPAGGLKAITYGS